MFLKFLISILSFALIQGCNPIKSDPILKKNDEIFKKIKNKEENVISEAKELIRIGKKVEAYTKLSWYLGVQNHRTDISRELLALHTQLLNENEIKIIVTKMEQEKLKAEQVIKMEKEAAIRKMKFEQKLMALHGKKPWKLPWKEYYSNVQSYLSESENDPSSIQDLNCSEPKLDLNFGWLVDCRYRSKNLYNALQKREAKLVISNSRVFEYSKLSQIPLMQRLELIKANK